MKKSLLLAATLWIRERRRSGNVISSLRLAFFVPAPFPLLPLLSFFQRRRRHPFLFLLEAAQRVRVALFPLPLLPPSLSVLLADALLLFQATDALLLGRTHQLSQLDGLDVVEGRLAGLVQHDGVEDDVEQRYPGDLLQACSHRVVLCGDKVVVWVCLLQHGQQTL